METLHGTRKACKFAPKDVISTMPDNVIANIMDRLEIQDAVRTGILSRNWRFKWTLLSQLMFDENFFKYYHLGRPIKYFNWRNIMNTLLLHLKHSITKFSLFIPYYQTFNLDAEDVNMWILLSLKRVKDLTLIIKYEEQRKLLTRLFACLELRHLKIQNCVLHPSPSFQGFPNLLSLDLYEVGFQDYNCGKLITRSPLLEILNICDCEPPGCVLKLAEIVNLQNLKVLSLSLCLLHNMTMIKVSSIFQHMCLLPQLEELYLDFWKCKLLAEAFTRENVSTAFPCLKTLKLYQINFGSDIMVAYALGMICGSPNLQTLEITAMYQKAGTEPDIEVDCNMIGHMQLRSVVLTNIKGNEIELCFIKSILARSPFLNKITIHPNSSLISNGGDVKFWFVNKLLRFPRGSPTAVIAICPLESL